MAITQKKIFVFYTAFFLIIAGATYVGLFIVETYLYSKRVRITAGTWEIKGAYENAPPPLNYKLAKNWSSYIDYGNFVTYIKTNSQGWRGPELDPEKVDDSSHHRLLLLGDSMTFGWLVDQSETIDAWLRPALNKWEVVNSGVPGYGFPEGLATLEQLTWLHPKVVVYVFYENDLRDGALAANGLNFGGKVIDGFSLPPQRSGAMDPSGLPPEAIKALATGSNLGYESSFISIVKLLRVRIALHLARPWSSLLNPDYYIDSTIGHDFKSDTLAKAIAFAKTMRQRAEENGARFYIFYTPTVIEAVEKRLSRPSQDFRDQLLDQKFSLISNVADFDISCYHVFDGHFNGTGAARVASLIASRLGQDKVIQWASAK